MSLLLTLCCVSCWESPLPFSTDSLGYVRVFESVVAVAFQSVFHSEMHQNNVFLFFLKSNFDISTLKRSENTIIIIVVVVVVII